ncbi:MAG TPA: hypothetical protein VGM62_10385 [Chthoniobacterales bacterium]|jgi:DUF4097 and DUF4098 domain-containing protein YvlB
MKTPRLTAIILRLLLIGAIVAPVSVAWANEILEEIVEQNYPIDLGAKFTLQNDDGSVMIYGAPIAEMKLQARKKAYSRERLRKINVDVSVSPGAVAVKTGYPLKPKWGLSDRSGTVDYVIILPWQCDVERVELGNGEMVIDGMRGNELHAQLGNGRLFGHNCFSENIKLSIGSGALEISYDWWENHPIAIETTIAAGNTRLLIPGQAKLHLHAETANGNIFSDFNNQENPTRRGQAKVDFRIGATPNAEMKIHAQDGSININEYNP